MKKGFLGAFAAVGLLIGGFGIAYATGTFNAIQQGFRQAGNGQAAKITMQVEAGMADPNSDLLPDSSCSSFSPCPGGALSFSITNNSDFPIRVTGISSSNFGCSVNGQVTTCTRGNSNKNTNGTYIAHDSTGQPVGVGTCSLYMSFNAPNNFDAWPTIAPHSALQVNGTDNNALGAGMLHLSNTTPNGCQGALFSVDLTVTATEVTTNFSNDNL